MEKSIDRPGDGLPTTNLRADWCEQAARTCEQASTELRAAAKLIPTAEDRHASISVTDAAIVRAIIRARRQREKLLPATLFGEPAWDILLELYLAELEQRRTTITAACVGAAVPQTTALRWISSLESESLIRRFPDPLDGRRLFVELTENASSLLSKFCVKLRETGALIPL